MWMVNMLVPIRESGALLPQAILSNTLAKVERRHRYWLAGVAIQMVSAIVIFIFAPFMNAAIAGYFVLCSLLLMSISRALVSLTSKDILGAHVDKGKRGKLTGLASSVSGGVSIILAVTAMFVEFEDTRSRLIMIGVASASTLMLAMLTTRAIKTHVNTKKESAYFNDASQSQDSAGDKNTIANVLRMLPKQVKRFVLARSLLVHSALVAPFFILSTGGNSIDSLFGFIVAQASASLISSFLWGKLADKNSVLTMQLGASICIMAILINLGIPLLIPDISQLIIAIGSFFILSIGHAAIRQGRKIYSVDIYSAHDRTEFVGQTNSFIGVVLLLLGGFYAALSALPSTILMSMMATALVIGIAVCFTLKKVN